MNRRITCSLLTLVALLAVGQFAFTAGQAQAEQSAQDRIFEMRIYTAPEGKIEALHDRFRTKTNHFFVKHGMDLVGYWMDEANPNRLVYILGYPSREAREKSWAALMADKAWTAAYLETVKDGRLVSNVEQTFMTPTDYSPIR